MEEQTNPSWVGLRVGSCYVDLRSDMDSRTHELLLSERTICSDAIS